MAVGLDNPLATSASLKPEGRVAAKATGDDENETSRKHADRRSNVRNG
jgi:hypothetical protein